MQNQYLFLKSWPTAPLMILMPKITTGEFKDVPVVVVIRGLVVDIEYPHETQVYAKTDSGLIPMKDLRHVKALDSALVYKTFAEDQCEIRDWDGRFRFNEVFGSISA